MVNQSGFYLMYALPEVLFSLPRKTTQSRQLIITIDDVVLLMLTSILRGLFV